jgi:hypothetical protein
MIENLKKWFDTLIIPREQLSNMPICPFARAVIQSKEYFIQETDLDKIAFQVSTSNVQAYKVCIYYLPDYENYEVEALEVKTKILNRSVLETNKVVLDNDPRSPFAINGVTTTFPDCYLWIVQDLADLTSKSNSLKFTDYYKHWTQEQIDEVITWRNHTEI